MVEGRPGEKGEPREEGNPEEEVEVRRPPKLTEKVAYKSLTEYTV